MNLYIVNLLLGNISISGDEGLPNIKLAGPSYTTIPVKDILGNQRFCQECSTFIAGSKITVQLTDSSGKVLTASQMLSLQSGTMFDLDDDGIVDEAENLNLLNKKALDHTDSPYTVLRDDTMLACDVSGGALGITLPAGIDGQSYTIQDTEGSAGTNNITITPAAGDTIEGGATYVLDTDNAGVPLFYDLATTDWKVLGVSGISSAAVALNTTHRGSVGTDHANVVTNDTHVAGDGSDHANVALNDTHRASNGTDHANVVTNDTHVAGDGSDHANVALNDTHRASNGTDHANVALNDTHRASNGTDHANVVTNDTHVAGDGSDHANVATNDTHVAGDGSDHANVALNDTHRASNGTDHANVVTNDTHVAGDGSDHANVALNDTHRASAGIDHSYIQDNIVDVVVTFPDAGGAGTTSAGTVQVKDLAGVNLAKECAVLLLASDTQYAGNQDLNANVAFSDTGAGSILGQGTGWAVVLTDATGLAEVTATNAVDETAWMHAASAPGEDALAHAVVVRGCIPDDVTWS